MNKIGLLLLTLISLNISNTKASAQWLRMNGPEGGDICSLFTFDSLALCGTRSGEIFRSVDSGESWKASCLLCNDSNLDGYPNVVHAFERLGNTLFACTDFGLCTSKNNGQNWYLSWSTNTKDLSGRQINCITTFRGLVFIGLNKGWVYRSADTGRTWQEVSNGLSGDSSVSALVSNETTVLVGAAGLFHSLDSGRSWSRSTVGLTNSRVYCLGVCGGAIFLSHTNWTPVLRSTDNGISWGTTNSPSETVFGFTETPNDLLLSNGSGIYRSSDDGINWYRDTTTFRTQMLRSGPIAHIGKTVLVGATDGLYACKDFTTGWQSSNRGLVATSVRSVCIAHYLLFAGTLNSGLCYSFDTGKTWRSTPPEVIPRTSSVSTLGFDGDLLYAGITPEGTNVGVFMKSPDLGFSWESIGYPISSVSAILAKDSFVFVGEVDGSVYRTSNGGQSWKELTDGLIKYFMISSFMSDSNVTYLSELYKGIFKSTDDGLTWNQVIENVNGPRTILSIGHNLLLGASVGIYMSSDLGLTWIKKSEGLGNRQVNSLTLNAGMIFAGTEGGGLWMRPLSDFIPRSVVSRDGAPFSISCFPNPMVSYTNIMIPAATSSWSIAIFNSLGVEVTKILSVQSEIDEQRIVWRKPERLPCGIYNCVLRKDAQLASMTLVIKAQ